MNREFIRNDALAMYVSKEGKTYVEVFFSSDDAEFEQAVKAETQGDWVELVARFTITDIVTDYLEGAANDFYAKLKLLVIDEDCKSEIESMKAELRASLAMLERVQFDDDPSLPEIPPPPYRDLEAGVYQIFSK